MASNQILAQKPQHVAIIMDGNGRWADNKGLSRIAGHRAGVAVLKKLIEYAVKINLTTITVYAFSQENWQRPQQEINLLMELFISTLEAEVAKLADNNICLKFIGERRKFSKKLQQSIDQSEALTAAKTGLTLNVAANYSGRWDIIQACKTIAKAVRDDELPITTIDEALFNTKCVLAKTHYPDLLIRTGGEQRISNYFLWQLAYTELYFTDTLWPDFNAAQFDEALAWFASRQRRFGRTSAQVANKS